MKYLLFMLLANSLAIDIAEEEAPFTPWIEDSSAFSCSFNSVYKEITLSIQIEEKHLELMVIKTGNDIPMILSLDDETISEHLLITPTALAQAKKLIIGQNIQALYWDHLQTKGLILDDSAKYNFYLSTNLESETGGYLCSLDITGV